MSGVRNVPSWALVAMVVVAIHGCAEVTPDGDDSIGSDRQALHWRALWPTAPIDGAAVDTVEPQFRWWPPALALVQVCSDPACAVLVEQFVGLGKRARYPGCLGEGDYFWRVSRRFPVPGLPWSVIESFSIDVSAGEADGFRLPLGGGLVQWEPFDWRAITLADGRVLALDDAGSPEIYDPRCESFRATGTMLVARRDYSATLLQDGRVLIAGGTEVGGSSLGPLATTEIYDPTLETFSAGPTMNQARLAHTATLLEDGRVLIAGGYGPLPPPLGPSNQLDTAEAYDPSSGAFVTVDSMSVTFGRHSAVRLASGLVLVAGGLHPLSVGGGARSEADLFDPATNAFTPTGDLFMHRSGARMTLLLDGRVLVTGGQSSGALSRPIELYDPVAGTFASAGEFPDGRSANSATRLLDGRVLIAGGTIQPGFGASEVTDRADLYDPATGIMSPTSEPLEAARLRHGAALLESGRVLLVGGTPSSAMDPTAELFVPATGP